MKKKGFLQKNNGGIFVKNCVKGLDFQNLVCDGYFKHITIFFFSFD